MALASKTPGLGLYPSHSLAISVLSVMSLHFIILYYSNCVEISVVTTIEFSPPPQWLATIKPPPPPPLPPRCCTVFLAFFLALFPENCPHYSAEQLYSL